MKERPVLTTDSLDGHESETVYDRARPHPCASEESVVKKLVPLEMLKNGIFEIEKSGLFFVTFLILNGLYKPQL